MIILRPVDIEEEIRAALAEYFTAYVRTRVFEPCM